MLSTLLIALGAAAVAVGLTADTLGIGGASGFGRREYLACGVGVVLLVVGLTVSPTKRNWLARVWRASPSVAFGSCALLGLWFGMLTGFVEAAHQAVAKYGFGRTQAAPDEAQWLVAVGYGAFFMAMGLVLGLPLRPWRRLITLPVAVFVFTGLAAWSQFLIHSSLSGIAVGALTVGVAVQSARFAAANSERLLRISRRTTPWMVGLIVLIAVALPFMQKRSEQKFLAGLPVAASSAPNVLLIVLDTVFSDHLGSYGYSRPTSGTVDALAEGGVLFEQCMSTAPWTVPAHATMFTGEYSHRLKEGWVGELPPGFPTLAEAFTAAGYATGGFVGNTKYCSRFRGLGRGFARYEDYQIDLKGVVLAGSLGRQFMGAGHEGHIVRATRNDAGTVTSRFLAWLSELDPAADRPFFGFLNYFDAHALYLPPPPYDTMFGPRADDLEQWGSKRRDFTPEQMAGFVRAYDGCIKLIDDHIQRILDHLDAAGELDNTLVIITSDHGEHFGEHGLVSHANSLYRPLLQVPLIFSWPAGISARKRVPEGVSLRDLPATILDLSGVRPASQFPGHSLARLWDGTPAGSIELSPVLAEVAPAGGSKGKPSWWPISWGTGVMKSLTEDGMHFILNGNDTGELYDFRVDPGEQNDLAGDEAHQATAARLRQRIADILGS